MQLYAYALRRPAGKNDQPVEHDRLALTYEEMEEAERIANEAELLEELRNWVAEYHVVTLPPELYGRLRGMLGGLSRSPAKQAASRANGRLAAKAPRKAAKAAEEAPASSPPGKPRAKPRA